MAAQTAQSRCGEGLEVVPAEPADGVVELGQPNRDHVDFRRARTQRDVNLRVPITGENTGIKAGDLILVKPTEFLREDDAQFPAEQVVVKRSQVGRNGQAVEILLCIDPSEPAEVEAGKYTGTVLIDDPRFQEKALTFTVNLQDDALWPALAIPAGALGGVLWAWGLARVAGTQTPEEKEKRRSTRKLLVELIVALVVAIGVGFGVFLTEYWADASWRLDPQSWWTLVGLIGAAAAASYPGASAAARAVYSHFDK